MTLNFMWKSGSFVVFPKIKAKRVKVTWLRQQELLVEGLDIMLKSLGLKRT